MALSGMPEVRGGWPVASSAVEEGKKREWGREEARRGREGKKVTEGSGEVIGGGRRTEKG